MVITFADHDAETPAGSPVGVPIPEAPVVVWVIFVNAFSVINPCFAKSRALRFTVL